MDRAVLSPESIIETPLIECPFVERIPLEIRRMVYQYLVGRHVKRELDMNSKDYNDQRNSILRGPDYTYRFHLSILGVSQQVRAEALDLHLSEHTFISITHQPPAEFPLYGSGWLDCGVTVLAQDDRAEKFPNIAMYIDFDTDSQPCVSDSGELPRRVVSVVPIDALSAACVKLQWRIKFNPIAISISIKITPYIGNTPVTSGDGSPVPGSKLRKCLDAMSQIRGAGCVEINGPVNDTYKAATIRAMCSRQFSIKETMALVGVQIDQGDNALAEGKLESAIAKYRAAFHTLRRTPFPRNADEEDELDHTLTGGRFHGVKAGRAMKNTKVRLHTLIANVYLRSGHHRLARVYVERICRPLAGVDYRFKMDRFPLRIENNPRAAAPWVYAELLLTAAKISLHHGRYVDASVELVEACYLDTSNAEVLQLHEECLARIQRRYERFAGQDERHERIVEQKYHDALQVLNRRKAKGDKAFAVNNFALAHRHLEAAYASVQRIHNTVWNAGNGGHYRSISANRYVSPDLITDIFMKLTIAALELHDFDQVHRWAAEIFALEPNFLEAYILEWCKGTVEWAREAHYTAYYCKAIALQKQGKIDGAIRHFKKALLCDNGCHAMYYQLEEAKGIKASEVLKTSIEEMKLKEHAKKRQEKIKRRKATKQGRRHDKKARALLGTELGAILPDVPGPCPRRR